MDLVVPSSSAPDEGAPTSVPLSKAVGRGLGWTVVTTVTFKFITFATQIVLGWLLTQKDFGVYATALAVAGMVTAFRDGGVRDILIQRGPAAYRSLVGPIFWLSLTVNFIAAIVLAGAAPFVARAYNEPSLLMMLLVIAVVMPLGTGTTILQCRLRMQLEFRAVGRITIASSIIRNGGAILFAKLGFGPLSFVLPLIPATILENVWSRCLVRERLWSRPAEVRRWPELFRSISWLIFGTLANIVFDMGPYIVLGAMTLPETVGVYYFAYQITAQIGVLLAMNAQQVLFPALTAMTGDLARMAAASLRTLRALMLVGGYMCLCLAAVMGPLEAFLWHGRWAAAVPAVQILGLLFPLRITFGLTSAILLASGRFKSLSYLTVYEGVGVTAAAALAAGLGGTATQIAWWTAAQVAVGRVLCTIYVMRGLGVGPGQVLRAILPPWVISIAAAVLAVACERLFQVATLAQSVAELAQLSPKLAHFFVQGCRVAFIGGLCTAAFAVATRLFIPTRLKEALSVGPRRIGAKIERLMLLK